MGLRLGRDQPGDLLEKVGTALSILITSFYQFLFHSTLHDHPPLLPLVILGMFRLGMKQIKEADDIYHICVYIYVCIYICILSPQDSKIGFKNNTYLGPCIHNDCRCVSFERVAQATMEVMIVDYSNIGLSRAFSNLLFHSSFTSTL